MFLDFQRPEVKPSELCFFSTPQNQQKYYILYNCTLFNFKMGKLHEGYILQHKYKRRPISVYMHEFECDCTNKDIQLAIQPLLQIKKIPQQPDCIIKPLAHKIFKYDKKYEVYIAFEDLSKFELLENKLICFLSNLELLKSIAEGVTWLDSNKHSIKFTHKIQFLIQKNPDTNSEKSPRIVMFNFGFLENIQRIEKYLKQIQKYQEIQKQQKQQKDIFSCLRSFWDVYCVLVFVQYARSIFLESYYNNRTKPSPITPSSFSHFNQFVLKQFFLFRQEKLVYPLKAVYQELNKSCILGKVNYNEEQDEHWFLTTLQYHIIQNKEYREELLQDCFLLVNYSIQPDFHEKTFIKKIFYEKPPQINLDGHQLPVFCLQVEKITLLELQISYLQRTLKLIEKSTTLLNYYGLTQQMRMAIILKLQKLYNKLLILQKTIKKSSNYDWYRANPNPTEKERYQFINSNFQSKHKQSAVNIRQQLENSDSIYAYYGLCNFEKIHEFLKQKYKYQNKLNELKRKRNELKTKLSKKNYFHLFKGDEYKMERTYQNLFRIGEQQSLIQQSLQGFSGQSEGESFKKFVKLIQADYPQMDGSYEDRIEKFNTHFPQKAHTLLSIWIHFCFFKVKQFFISNPNRFQMQNLLVYLKLAEKLDQNSKNLIYQNQIVKIFKQMSQIQTSDKDDEDLIVKEILKG